MVEVLLQTLSSILGHMIKMINFLCEVGKILNFVMLPIIGENLENLSSMASNSK